jgi:hypothetical protein
MRLTLVPIWQKKASVRNKISPFENRLAKRKPLYKRNVFKAVRLYSLLIIVFFVNAVSWIAEAQTPAYRSRTPVRHHRAHRPARPTAGSTHYYTNSEGNRVQSPTFYTAPPASATAQCRDGTYSFSQSKRGTCSYHGGVKRWR